MAAIRDSHTLTTPQAPADWVAVGFALALLAALVYARVATFGFVTLDDQIYVERNPHVLGGFTRDNVAWAFTTFHATNWHPLTWLSHMLDAEMFGAGARGPHVVNVLLHAANTWLCFALLTSVTGARWKSAAVAALFAVHPLHVESVAWISERKDLLSTLFWFAATWSFVRWTRSGKRGAYLTSLALFACALLSKPMPVTLPFTLLLLDFWPLARWSRGWRALLVEKLPFFALSIASAVMTWAAQSTGAASTVHDVSLAERAANAVVSYGVYLWWTVWPAGLAAFHPHPALEGAAHPAWKIALALVVLAAATSAAWRWRISRPWFWFGWCWFLGTLVPVIGLVQVGQQALADRYTYVPLIGVFVILAWGCDELAHQLRVPRAITAAVASGVVLVLGWCAMKQTAYWRNGVSLYERCVSIHPRSAAAWAGLGDAEAEQGAAESAFTAYRRALELDAASPRAVVGLGIASARAGRFDEALPLLERGVRLAPADPNAWYNLGALRGNAGRHADAARAFEEALKFSPEDANALSGLSIARRSSGDRAAAIEAAERLSRIDPARGREVRALVDR